MSYGLPYVFQRITCTVNSQEQKRLLMDLDVNMRTGSCPYAVKFYGALFREVSCAVFFKYKFYEFFMNVLFGLNFSCQCSSNLIVWSVFFLYSAFVAYTFN